MEIERKWLVDTIPEGMNAHYANEQFYLSTGAAEVRLRKCVPLEQGLPDKMPFSLAVKSEGGLVREEYETPVSEEFYEGCKRLITQPAITKDYYTYAIDGKTVEVSMVDEGVFIYAEVEFESEEEARKYRFPWPEIVIREVTNNPGFNMKNYWENGHLPIDV